MYRIIINALIVLILSTPCFAGMDFTLGANSAAMLNQQHIDTLVDDVYHLQMESTQYEIDPEIKVYIDNAQRQVRSFKNLADNDNPVYKIELVEIERSLGSYYKRLMNRYRYYDNKRFIDEVKESYWSAQNMIVLLKDAAMNGASVYAMERPLNGK